MSSWVKTMDSSLDEGLSVEEGHIPKTIIDCKSMENCPINNGNLGETKEQENGMDKSLPER